MVQLRSGRSTAEVAQDLAADSAYSSLSDAAFVDRIHRNLLDRAPTSAEQASSTRALASGSTRGRVLADLADRSDVVSRLAPEVQVGMTYLGMLARSPDASGYTFWVDRVRAGTSAEGLIAQFLASAEYLDRVT